MSQSRSGISVTPPRGGDPYEIVSPSAENMKLSMMIWGVGGTGKSTLAASAPGTKLFLMFDPDGENSLTARDDVKLIKLAHVGTTDIITQFASADPFGIHSKLLANPQYETIVIDSMTALNHVALQYAVTKSGGSSHLEQPGQNGYTYRNATMLKITLAMMKLCSAHGKHLILVLHEGTTLTKDGVPIVVGTSLSESLEGQVGLRFNEIWHIEDVNAVRRIAVRSCRMRKPMKTRLFNADRPEFIWNYDANTQRGDSIASWYNTWVGGGGVKLPLPKDPVQPATPAQGAVKR